MIFKTSSRKGLTLIELMVAVVVMGVALIALYAMLSTTAQTFHHQELRAENQGNVRFSSEILKLDLMLAGHNATPFSVKDDRVCPKPLFKIPAIQSTRTTLAIPGLSETIAFDDLLIVGDPTGMPAYRMLDIKSASELVIEAEAMNFLDQFRPPNLLRVTNPDGFFQFAPIASAEDDGTGALLVKLATPIQPARGGSPCGYQGLAAQNHTANIVTAHRYTIQVDPDEAFKTNLLRFEYDLANDRNIGNGLLIAEYAVGLDILAVGSTNLNMQDTSVDKESDADLFSLDESTSSSASVIDLSTNPHRARFLHYRVRTRTQRAVPRRAVVSDSVQSAAATEKLYFKLPTGIAEVRTLQGRVQLPNLSLRNLR